MKLSQRRSKSQRNSSHKTQATTHWTTALTHWTDSTSWTYFHPWTHPRSTRQSSNFRTRSRSWRSHQRRQLRHSRQRLRRNLTDFMDSMRKKRRKRSQWDRRRRGRRMRRFNCRELISLSWTDLSIDLITKMSRLIYYFKYSFLGGIWEE